MGRQSGCKVANQKELATGPIMRSRQPASFLPLRCYEIGHQFSALLMRV